MSEQLENIDFLKKSMEFMGEEELRRTLTYLIKVYVMDSNSKQESFNSLLPSDKKSSFFDLVSVLKREYETPELDMFQMESGKVYFEIDNRRFEVAKSDSLMPTAAPVMDAPDFSQPVPEQPADRTPVEEDNQPQRFRSLEF